MQEEDRSHGICGAHGGHETAEVRDGGKIGGGRGLRGGGGEEKEWMRCLQDDLRAFGVTATSGRLQPRTRGNGARRRNKGRSVHGESRGWTTACSSRSMSEHDGKDQGEDSPKQACSCWFANHGCRKWRELIPSGRFLGLQMSCCLSLALRFYFVSFSSFRFHRSRGPSSNRSSIQQHSFGTTLRFTGPVSADSRE